MGAALTELPLPEHWRPEHAFKAGYGVTDPSALQQQAELYRARHRLRPACEDPVTVHLLVIDMQVDFAFPDGTLFVAGRSGRGAMEAQEHLVRFLYRNLHLITTCTFTLDTHVPFQIFFPVAHLTPEGTHPPPHTTVSAGDYLTGRLKPNPAFAAQLGVTVAELESYYLHYLRELESRGKYRLCLWPYHCLLGSEGHRLSGVVHEARLFHSFARQSANKLITKGSHPLTENYSVFAPEVTTRPDGTALGEGLRNQKLLEELLGADMILIAGLASSHCVKESTADLLGEISRRDPALARKVYLLRDCTAAVVVPGVADFTAEAEKAFCEFQQAGAHIVDSTTAPSSWPDSPL